MTDKCVDIIIPVYKAEKYLPSCLECLLVQTYKNIHVIFVDDCSPDKSREIVKGYEEKYPFITGIYCDKNGGAAAARNTALENATSDYVFFLDSDDTLEPDALEIMVREATEKGADIVQSGYRKFYPDGSRGDPILTFKTRTVLDRDDFGVIYKKMLTGISMNQIVRTLFRRETIGDLKMPTDFKTGEDLVFFSSTLTKARKYIFIPEPLYNYYQSGTGLTGSSLLFKEKWNCLRRSSTAIKENLKKTGELNFKYKLLAGLRPYLVTVDKLSRTIRKV